MGFRQQGPLSQSSGYPGVKIDWGQTIKDTLPVVGSVAGSVLDYIGQRNANTATARSAQEQIAFQREQSATQYQRGVKDMEAAGLNPGLAYKAGGNEAASGASYEARPNTSNTGARMMDAINAYQQLANGTAQRAQIYAQTRNVEADTAMKMPMANLSHSADYRTNFNDTTMAELRQRMQAAQSFPEKYAAELKNLKQNTATAFQAAQEARSRTTLNEQEFTNEWFRKNMAPWINSSVKTLQPIADFIPKARFR